MRYQVEWSIATAGGHKVACSPALEMRQRSKVFVRHPEGNYDHANRPHNQTLDTGTNIRGYNKGFFDVDLTSTALHRRRTYADRVLFCIPQLESHELHSLAVEAT